MSIIQYHCRQCKTKYTREIAWIDPSKFLKEPTMKTVFWCSGWNCENLIALKVEFKPGEKIIVKGEESTEGMYDSSKDETTISARPRSKRGGAH